MIIKESNSDGQYLEEVAGGCTPQEGYYKLLALKGPMHFMVEAASSLQTPKENLWIAMVSLQLLKNHTFMVINSCHTIPICLHIWD